MKNKYGIGFLLISVTAILIITCAYQLSYHRAKEQAQEARIKTEKEPAMEPEKAIATKGDALKEDCYYLMEVNGYIVVYLSDKKTPYEYTDILFDELPEKLQEEIRNGKYIEDTKTLYGFLENYSS